MVADFRRRFWTVLIFSLPIILLAPLIQGWIGVKGRWQFPGREFVFSLERMVTVMVISCPHALGLAVPLVVAASTALAAR